MVRKLSSSLRPMELSCRGWIRYFGEGLGGVVGVFGEEQVAVVVEVADDVGVRSSPFWRCLLQM